MQQTQPTQQPKHMDGSWMEAVVVSIVSNAFIVEVHRLIIGHYRPIIGRLYVLVSKTTKNAFNCSSH